MIAELENINIATWTAPLKGSCHGWTLCLGGGYSRRANCVYTHDYQGDHIETDLAYCEAVYEMHQAKPRFRTTLASEPSHLHQILKDRGYQQSFSSHVKTCDLRTVTYDAHPDFMWSNEFQHTWLQQYMRLNHIKPELYTSHEMILRTMPEAVCFGEINHQAIGLAVKVGTTVAFYDIVVDSEARGQGYGRAIMESLLHWAQQNGATQGMLCVDGENNTALKLYDALGFKTQYDYWYWD